MLTHILKMMLKCVKIHQYSALRIRYSALRIRYILDPPCDHRAFLRKWKCMGMASCEKRAGKEQDKSRKRAVLSNRYHSY